jgi:hypothetical protein
VSPTYGQADDAAGSPRPALYVVASARDIKTDPWLLRIRHFTLRRWYRVIRLIHARGQMSDLLAEFLKHASLEADRAGLIGDVPRWVAKYAAALGISERLAYDHRRLAVSAGWVRKALGAAPGRKASYVLQIPVRQVPGDLPDDLAEQLHTWDEAEYAEDAHDGTSYGHLRDVSTAMVSREAPEQWPAYAPTQAVDGPADPEELAATRARLAAITVGLQTSPYTRGSYPPPLSFPDVVGGSSSDDHSQGPVIAWPFKAGLPPHPDEFAAAAEVFVRCEPIWAKQRGNRAGLSVDEAIRLIPWVILALRRTTPGAVEELLADKVRSAQDLCGALWWRLERFVRGSRDYDHRRPRRVVAADEFGARHARLRAELDAYADAVRDWVHAHAEGCREYVALVRADRDLAQADRDAARAAEPAERPALREPEHVYRASLGGEARAVYDGHRAAAAPPRRTDNPAAVLARARRDRAARGRSA